ncbi:MAG TPA: response regulator, partial [Myxococcota bacterium]|nr:response regulator [Myxococcota bacterium]
MAGTVLVVDDDRNIHGFFRAMLEPEGLVVLCEADAQWAQRIFEKREVDFVILGNLGSQPDEFELAKRIRKSPKGERVPLLMIGGQGCRDDVLQAARNKYKLVDFLTKPLEAARVFEALRTRFDLDMPSVIARPQPPARSADKAHAKTHG